MYCYVGIVGVESDIAFRTLEKLLLALHVSWNVYKRSPPLIFHMLVESYLYH